MKMFTESAAVPIAMTQLMTPSQLDMDTHSPDGHLRLSLGKIEARTIVAPKVSTGLRAEIILMRYTGNQAL